MRYFSVILLVVIAGCLSTPKNATPSGSFFYAEKAVAFTSADRKDLFSIVALGPDTLDALVLFSIRNAAGDTIYLDSLNSASFCGTGEDPDSTHDPLFVTSVGRKSLLFRGLHDFFADSRFDRPAIAFDTLRDVPYADSLVWNELRHDSGAVGFRYNKYLDAEIGVAYSKIQHKVVEYYATP